MTSPQQFDTPTKAFRLSALGALLIGGVAYAIGLVMRIAITSLAHNTRPQHRFDKY